MASYEELNNIVKNIHIYKGADNSVRLYACKVCVKIYLANAPMWEHGEAEHCSECNQVYCTSHMTNDEGDLICPFCIK